MPKWRIIIPVLIVMIIGVIAYMMTNPSSAPTDQSTPAAGESNDIPLEAVGNEDIGTQAYAMVDELLQELDDEEAESGDGTEEINSITGGESDIDILDVDYYEE